MNISNVHTYSDPGNLNRQRSSCSNCFVLSKEDVAKKNERGETRGKRQLAGIIENYCNNVGRKKSR